MSDTMGLERIEEGVELQKTIQKLIGEYQILYLLSLQGVVIDDEDRDALAAFMGAASRALLETAADPLVTQAQAVFDKYMTLHQKQWDDQEAALNELTHMNTLA